MLHQSIVSDIRDHFSTVGPSPSASLPTPVLFRESSSRQSPFQTGSNRFLLLPSPNSKTDPEPSPGTEAAPTRFTSSSLSFDVLSTAAHRCSAFFAEAAVLVLVLGILDRFLASNRIELRWISGAFAIALGLLAASIATDVSARRWLRAH